MKFKIAYHPVWEQTLTNPEKEKYEQVLANYNSDEQFTSTCLIVLKEKKNGGLVATAFICNGSNTVLQIQETTAKIINEKNDVIATANFAQPLTIPPYKAMPWSFVFSPDQLTRVEIPNDQWSLLLSSFN